MVEGLLSTGPDPDFLLVLGLNLVNLGCDAFFWDHLEKKKKEKKYSIRLYTVDEQRLS